MAKAPTRHATGKHAGAAGASAKRDLPKPWTVRGSARLRHLFHEGHTDAEIAKALGCDVVRVGSRRVKLGLLRRERHIGEDAERHLIARYPALGTVTVSRETGLQRSTIHKTATRLGLKRLPTRSLKPAERRRVWSELGRDAADLAVEFGVPLPVVRRAQAEVRASIPRADLLAVRNAYAGRPWSRAHLAILREMMQVAGRFATSESIMRPMRETWAKAVSLGLHVPRAEGHCPAPELVPVPRGPRAWSPSPEQARRIKRDFLKCGPVALGVELHRPASDVAHAAVEMGVIQGLDDFVAKFCLARAHAAAAAPTARGARKARPIRTR